LLANRPDDLGEALRWLWYFRDELFPSADPGLRPLAGVPDGVSPEQERKVERALGWQSVGGRLAELVEQAPGGVTSPATDHANAVPPLIVFPSPQPIDIPTVDGILRRLVGAVEMNDYGTINAKHMELRNAIAPNAGMTDRDIQASGLPERVKRALSDLLAFMHPGPYEFRIQRYRGIDLLKAALASIAPETNPNGLFDDPAEQESDRPARHPSKPSRDRQSDIQAAIRNAGVPLTRPELVEAMKLKTEGKLGAHLAWMVANNILINTPPRGYWFAGEPVPK